MLAPRIGWFLGQQLASPAPVSDAGSLPSTVCIVGSAFSTGAGGTMSFDGCSAEPVVVETPWGPARLFELQFPGVTGRRCFVLPRHGARHSLLPHEIPYRAHAAALRILNCKALLTTSSVGLLNASLPSAVVLAVRDIIMLENRLPDGGPCSLFCPPTHAPLAAACDLLKEELETRGHLVLSRGLCHEGLTTLAERLAADPARGPVPRVVFGYVPGPRTKTAAENVAWRRLGADVNSMTLAPELVLAAELRIPAAAAVIGHKRSSGSASEHGEGGPRAMRASLVDGKAVLQRVVLEWLRTAPLDADCGSYVYKLEH